MTRSNNLFTKILKDFLPTDLNTKYFDFKEQEYSTTQFCESLLTQLTLSYDNCTYYREKLCPKFNFSIPDELSMDNLQDIPYIPSSIYKKSGLHTLELLKVPLDEIALFSCSSSTSGNPSIVPRTIEDFDQIQYNSIKCFTDFFRWNELKENNKKPLVFNFSPGRFLMAMMARKNVSDFPYKRKTRYFTACMNKPWEFFGHEEYLVKGKLLKTLKAIITTLSIKGGFVLDVSKMLKMIRRVKKTGFWKTMEVSKMIFGGSPLLMNNMFDNRLLKEKMFYDLDGLGFVGCGGGGWEGVKGEAKMDAVNKSEFIGKYEKVFNIKSKDIADIYAFTEGPTLFGGHWSKKYQDFLLHCPHTSRILVRDIKNFEVVGEGEEGLLEVITPYGVNGSVNQAVIVDDIVELISKHKCPECGYQGATFRILGRLKNLQGKSCSSLFDWVY
ncbi:MAG: hypothetical protein BAJALOKI1v1_380016 [Promethearchaeota archaeon]|nr:MAG: hypothetical protein BAJALOKI1v1_380016 [Candidatus Lokiarchaeota archaeon]